VEHVELKEKNMTQTSYIPISMLKLTAAYSTFKICTDYWVSNDCTALYLFV